jgi:hypothetical protein
MPFSRRIAASLAVAGLMLLPTVPAAASTLTSSGGIRPMAATPSDCMLLEVYPDTTTMTCTARPAGQQWLVAAYCYVKPGVDSYRVGNTVTGDGTSSIDDCYGGAAEAEFILVS